MNSRSVAIFATVVAILVGTAIWFLNSDIAPHASPKVEPEVAIAKPTQPPVKSRPEVAGTKPKAEPMPTTQAPVVAAETPAPPITEDDRKIDEVLRLFNGNTDQDNTNTAQSLINLLPALTKDGQTECAQHISNLLSDEEYKRIMPIWRNPSYNPDVIEVFATDLMNRPSKIMLPAMLDAIKMPNHPYHEEAKSTMQVFLDEDYGDNIPKWESAMKTFLKKEADEEKEANTPDPVGVPK
jgi:hypothetical protein